MARTVSGRDAARGLELGAAGDERDRVGGQRRAHVVEQDACRTCTERLPHLVERLGLDLDRKRSVAFGEHSERGGNPAGEAEVVLLDEDRVVETGAMVAAATAADGVLLEGAQPGSRLARVEDRRAGAVDEIDERARERRHAAQSADEVDGDALSAENGARVALDLGDDRGRLRHHGSLRECRLDPRGGIERAEDGGGHGHAADDARLLELELRTAAEPVGDERLGRDVSGADVLGECGGRDALDRLLCQLHRSLTGSSPRRRTMWTGSTPSAGKSSRKWTPRLSERARALQAMSRARG